MRTLIKVAAIVLPAVSQAQAGGVLWMSSVADKPWQAMPAPALTQASDEAPAQIRVLPERAYQTIDGFGGCFNEMGWEALKSVSDDQRDRAIASLFSDEGCGFTLARIPIGASDFALDAYSLDDTPDDYELKHFSIERDRHALIPFVKSAMRVRPTLACWGSPWSPPAWMKTNNSYSDGSLRWERRILQCYARYFARWIEAYRLEGIDVYAIAPQNEPNIVNVYPTCLWTGPQLREFIAAYLGPTLRERKVDVQLWLGLNGDPPNNGDNINDRLTTVMDDPAAGAFVTGIAFQYDSRNQIALTRELYPQQKLMQSETECHSGKNSWADAQRLYALMKRYFDGGASSYFMWNMVLDETGMSTWGWQQNAMITVHRDTGTVTHNGEYYVMRHFSQFVKPGARRVLSMGPWGDKIAFQNRDGSVVFVVGNSADREYSVVLNIAARRGGDTLNVTLPAKSINTIVVPASE